MIVEDVITTGGSVLETVTILEEAGQLQNHQIQPLLKAIITQTRIESNNYPDKD